MGNAVTIYIGLLTSLFGGMGPLWNEDVTCAITYMIVSMSSFLINIFAISMLVSKMTQPDPEAVLSSNAIIKTRNGVPVFQVRHVSAHGHLLTNVSIRMYSFLPTKTLEGETFVGVKEMKAEISHRGGVIVMAGNHYIDEDSPIYGADFTNFKGFIEVIVTAYDEFLGCELSTTETYDMSNIKAGYDFADPYLVRPQVYLQSLHDKNPSKIEINVNKIGDVVPLAPESGKILEQVLKTHFEIVQEKVKHIEVDIAASKFKQDYGSSR